MASRALNVAGRSAAPPPSARTAAACMAWSAARAAHRRGRGRGAPRSRNGSGSRRRPRSRRTAQASRGQASAPVSARVDRDALLQALFPAGIPAKESVLESVNRWLEEAERLARMG
jgi:hypothetical protein